MIHFLCNFVPVTGSGCIREGLIIVNVQHVCIDDLFQKAIETRQFFPRYRLTNDVPWNSFRI